MDAAADVGSILEKIRLVRSGEFRRSLEGMTNPYGDGRAAETIVRVLTSVPLGQDLFMKRAVSLPVAAKAG